MRISLHRDLARDQFVEGSAMRADGIDLQGSLDEGFGHQIFYSKRDEDQSKFTIVAPTFWITLDAGGKKHNLCDQISNYNSPRNTSIHL